MLRNVKKNAKKERRPGSHGKGTMCGMGVGHSGFAVTDGILDQASLTSMCLSLQKLHKVPDL